ncbi:hypothetical protein D3C76_706870 [compost metagenome]
MYTYCLARKEGIQQQRIHNKKLSGVSINGEVLDVQGEKVKLHLEIDSKQSKSEAYWFPFAPPTGNVMYCMPKAGTSATLYFPNDRGSKSRVTGCVRTNGADCAKTGNPNNRYFGTEHGSELELTPTAINVVSGSKEPLMISFDDASGVIIKSHRKLTLNAAEEISLTTPKRILIKTTNLIMAKKLSKLSGFTIEGEYHLLGDQVNNNGSDRTPYTKYQDEPATWTPPEPKPKKFKWGKLFGNVLAGLAVVAVVTAVAVLCVATCGAGAVIIGAVAAGAAISGTAAVASMAVSDIMRGEVSDTGDYMMAALRESSIGAISGAVFGPFGSMGTLGGKVLIGATTNAFESIIRQGMEGKGFSLKTMVIDTVIGGVTGGVMDSKIVKKVGGALGDGLNKVAPWISNGFEKVGNQFNKYVGQLAEAGSTLGSKYLGNNLVPANGANIHFSLSNKIDPGSGKLAPTEVQMNYNKVMKELEEEAEQKAAQKAAGGAQKVNDGPEIPGGKKTPEGTGDVGKYDTKIKWGINDINARPHGKGFFGERIPQSNPRVDDFELKINPNNESYYLPHPNGGYVQFENLAGNVLQDGKLIIKPKSFYHVDDLPQFAKDKVVQEALRQQESALAAGYKVEWLVSDAEAVKQLTNLFKSKNIDIIVKYFPE